MRRGLGAPGLRATVRVAWTASIGLVVVLSAVPDPTSGGPPGIDKLWHALAYLALGFGAAFGRPGPQCWMAVAAMVTLGWAVEGLQGLLPWRSAEVADGLVNTVAAAAGGGLAVALTRRATRPTDPPSSPGTGQ
ncbi:hypothetical protein CKO28_09770 [Rhodovibrio sodomensis]|uniref:VanZ-like domain-containing protein n=1 Tax=Rhodovibrio sodomensis TaxID=1088 RepID=A0ABS1DED0_9PROT|nr:hypothetical protein [Rhodovibrio sodomensis]